MDRLSKLEREIEALRETVAGMRLELAHLRQDFLAAKHPVEVWLAQRGLPVLSHGDPARVLFPPDISEQRLTGFYELMRRYSFRLFVRELIQNPTGTDVHALCRYCSTRTARSFLAALAGAGVVRIGPSGDYALVPRHIISFGPTLEWFVCETLRREFLAPSLCSVRLRMTRHGGDYDVVSLVNRHLVYVEVKSSPPRGVEQPAVDAFLNRLRDLRPHVAIFLVDTQLRMKDKIVPMFEEAFEKSAGGARGVPAVQRLVNEIFHVGHALFLVNSQKGIYSNLRACLSDFHRSSSEARLPVED